MSVRFLLLWVAAIAIMIATHNSSARQAAAPPGAAVVLHAAAPLDDGRPAGFAPESRPHPLRVAQRRFYPIEAN